MGIESFIFRIGSSVSAGDCVNRELWFLNCEHRIAGYPANEPSLPPGGRITSGDSQNSR